MYRQNRACELTVKVIIFWKFYALLRPMESELGPQSAWYLNTNLLIGGCAPRIPFPAPPPMQGFQHLKPGQDTQACLFAPVTLTLTR